VSAPGSRGAAAAAIAGAVLGSLLAGAGWGWLYGLGGTAAAMLACAHLAVGIALGIAVGFGVAFAGGRGRHGAAAGIAASLTLLGIAPAMRHLLVSTPAHRTAASHELARVEPRGARAARVALIGLDGADWSVIDPLLAAGQMPNLARLVARGRSAVLRSIEPTISPVVWTSIFSGRTPPEHGIVGWKSAHAANRRVGMLWEIAGAAGLSSVVVNVPGTWPPTGIEGALLSGFPMPGALLQAGADPRLAQNVASVVSVRPRPGPLRTTVMQPAEDGQLRAEAPLGGWLDPAPSRLRHFAIDAAIRRGWLPMHPVRIAVSRLRGGDPDASAWTVDGVPIVLARGAWSPWIAKDSPLGALHLRVRRLEEGALLVTPAFQDSRAPIHPYASSREVRDVVADQGLYVVEPTGWKTTADPGARDAVFEHLVDVEQMHLRASLALRARIADWRVFADVITLPDRVSHAFWRFHHPEDYPAVGAAELAAHRDKVVLAYRESDRLLGLLLEGLPSDAAVIVLSDHGFTSEGDMWGAHRIEGVLVAAGAGITPGAERVALSVYDVTPLALALLGLPIARDFAGEVPTALITPGAEAREIASYERGSGAPEGRPATTSIDESTEEQLRGLGYIE
jgi:Type I phosphodiesterase / nucleotide pyrophosphatase